MHAGRRPLNRLLLWIGVVLIPLTSLQVMPSDYRPVSVFFLLIPGMLFLLGAMLRDRVPKDEFSGPTGPRRRRAGWWPRAAGRS